MAILPPLGDYNLDIRPTTTTSEKSIKNQLITISVVTYDRFG